MHSVNLDISKTFLSYFVFQHIHKMEFNKYFLCRIVRNLKSNRHRGFSRRFYDGGRERSFEAADHEATWWLTLFTQAVYPCVLQHAHMFRKKQLTMSLTRTNVLSRGTSSAELMAQNPWFQGHTHWTNSWSEHGGALLHSIDQVCYDKFRPAISKFTWRYHVKIWFVIINRGKRYRR